MKNTRKILLSVFLICSAPAIALNGAQLYTKKTCHTCHGPKGKAMIPNYPSLAGQNKQYLINQTKDIKSGKRKNGMTMLMKANPLVQKLTTAEIEAIATYLSGLK